MKRLLDNKLRTPSVVGLDIGSCSVRAAEVTRGRSGPVLKRFAQVELPHGAVVDGEVVDPGTVVTALRRLWSEGAFTSRNVVLAMSGQGVIVRQAEVDRMSEGDFRSALQFQATDLLPIPVDDAVLDFVILPPRDGDATAGNRMQILLAAAPRHLVESHLAILREASLRPVALDPAAMAAVRANDHGSSPGDRTAAIVDIGADVTLVVVEDRGCVRFSRTLGTGGSDLTARLADRLALDQEQAEGLKRDSSRPGQSDVLLDEELEPLLSGVESSLAFFASQLGGASPDMVVSGGPSRSAGLMARLEQRASTSVLRLDALGGLDCSGLELDPVAMTDASFTGLLSIGAAEWTFEPPARRLSLLPREMAVAAEARRRAVVLAAGVGALVVGLAVLSLGRSHQVASARSQLASARAATARAQAKVNAMAPVTQLIAAAQSRLSVVQTDGSDNVAWGQLLEGISAAMPPGTHLVNLAFTGVGGSTGAAPAAAGATSTPAAADSTSGPLGSVTMSVKGAGGEEQVAKWLRALRTVPGLQDVWVPSASSSADGVTFTSTGGVTSAAPMVQRAAAEGDGS